MSQISRTGLAVGVVTAILAAYGLGRHSSVSEAGGKPVRHVLYYVDPMHPAYKSDKPGTAPDCGMQLEPVYAEDLENRAPSSTVVQMPAGVVTIDGTMQRLLGIKVAEVEDGGWTHTVHAVGRVAAEDTRVYHVNAGVDGLIRETYHDSVGTLVRKDQKLATFYSPEFLSVASGFLAATAGVPGAVGKDGARTMPYPGALSKQGVSSLQGYSDRLRNLGMSDVQIQNVADSHQLPENIDVVAPAGGFIVARNISPGQHFDHTLEFYEIADLSHVWVVAEVPEREVSYMRPGGKAQIILREQGRQFAARIADSLPQSDPGGGIVKLRLEADNPKFILRPEMVVDIELSVSAPRAVTVPVDALIASGEHSRVYVERGEGIFEPREVQTGWRSGERVEILHGAQPGERVVVAATFLVDSESRLKAPAAEESLRVMSTMARETKN
jgi:membrane fusion protein, copper/silver efflux system